MVRLIADDGKVLINGNQMAFCVDTFPENAGEWSEIDKADENTEILEDD